MSDDRDPTERPDVRDLVAQRESDLVQRRESDLLERRERVDLMERRREAMRRVLSMYSGLFLFLFGGLISWGVYHYVSVRILESKDFGAVGFSAFEVILLAIALFLVLACVLYGARSMISGAQEAKLVITAEDRSLLEDLIRSGNEKAIDQYVRLSSLTGTTGTATKLGLSGLPLATVGLTLFFSIIAIFHVEGFMDLAKLTLGAFIGSFVQRSVSGERAADAR
jgi:hypothetical protein